MKTWKHCAIACILTIIALVFIACGNDPVCTCPIETTYKTNKKCCKGIDCDCTITRKFIIALYSLPQGWPKDKDIIVRDARTDPDTDLETLGIISKLETTLRAYVLSGPQNFWIHIYLRAILYRNLEIVVQQTTAYDDFRILSGNQIRVSFIYISSVDDEELKEKMADVITAVYNLPDPNEN